ncbi:DUF6446 family protein [Pseudoprimorskyibacter insulae]|uniref:Histidine kinase n=1 Tax=Pseudoprimorskyibacter insulae TaxID=1695997 RepID=A0A2R8AR60_9RHOB|nr:DUF6446 family protein [Pseudoprimorskyibacter insulae]SPF78450.1 hypothetical protein PRI8871_01053 [Pseudoprimorskyibacter insulae]
MNGKLVGSIVIGAALTFGAVVYYTQVYYYYDTVPANGSTDVVLTSLATGQPEAIPYADFQAIDAGSSPIRYRACFTTTMSLAALSETYEAYEGAVPRNAPGWFECFDAEAVGAALESGEALPFTVLRNIEFGIDRVAAITADGRGYVWEEVNDCGDKAYDGTPLGEDCPER